MKKTLVILLALVIFAFPTLAAAAQDSIVMAGKEAHVPAGSVHSGSVIVFGSNAIIEGRVRDDVVVIFGDLHLEAEAVVDGDVVVVGGSLVRKPGSQIGGEQVSIGLGDINIGSIPHMNLRPFRWMSPLAAVWRVLAIAFMGWVVFWLFPGSVSKVSVAAQAEPLRAVLYGLLAYLAMIPLSLVFLITIVGIPVIPLLWLALFVGRFLGQVALALLAGRYLAKQLNREMADALSVVLGLLVLGIVTIIPVVGGLAALFYGLLGFGSVVWTKFGRNSVA